MFVLDLYYDRWNCLRFGSCLHQLMFFKKILLYKNTSKSILQVVLEDFEIIIIINIIINQSIKQ